jgi:ATP-binding cassette subfamily B protein
MPPQRRAPEKPKNVIGTIKRIFSYLSGNSFLLIAVFVGIILSALCQVLGGSFLRPVIDDYIAPLARDPENRDLMLGFIWILVRMGLVYGVGALSTWVYSRLLLTVSTKALFRIRQDLFRRMEKLPIRYFDSRTHGELMSLYTNDVDAMREMLSNSLSNIISGMINVVGFFIVMLLLSWQLTLVMILSIFVMTWTTKTIGGKRRDSSGVKENRNPKRSPKHQPGKNILLTAADSVRKATPHKFPRQCADRRRPG